MGCLQAVQTRRSVRSYLVQNVDAEQVQTVIEAAAVAPSARNLQPWRFQVYMNSDEIDELGYKVKEWMFRLPIDEPFASPMHSVLNDPAYKVFYGAPVLILVIATDATTQSRQDCCLAAENLLLAARSMDLGAAWVGTATAWFLLAETKRLLKLTDACVVVAPIVLGHAASWPEAPQCLPPNVRWCSLPKT